MYHLRRTLAIDVPRPNVLVLIYSIPQVFDVGLRIIKIRIGVRIGVSEFKVRVSGVRVEDSR